MELSEIEDLLRGSVVLLVFCYFLSDPRYEVPTSPKPRENHFFGHWANHH
jgi:hypothetical protein